MEENVEEKICFLRKEVYISLAASTGSAYCSVLCTTDICHWHVGHSWILDPVSLPAATWGQVWVLDKIELGFDLPTQPARSLWAVYDGWEVHRLHPPSFPSGSTDKKCPPVHLPDVIHSINLRGLKAMRPKALIISNFFPATKISYF